MIQKISTSLWFEKNAEEAVNFYVSLFKNSSIGRTIYYGEAGIEFHKQPKGTPMLIEFTLDSVQFTAINGGPTPGFEFTPAISLVITCDTQDEIDYFWEKLGEGGEHSQCGWLKDKYGISWQIDPTIFSTFSQKDEPEKFNNMMIAMMQMQKLDIAKLKAAYEG